MLKEKIVSNYRIFKTWILENKLRTGAIGCTLLVLVGFFMPFASARAGVTVDGLTDKPFQVVSPQKELVSINLGDFVLQQKIESIEVLETPLGEVEFLGTSVIEILRSKNMDTTIVNNINETLNSSALDFLIDPEVQKTIGESFESGQEINAILTGSWNILQNAKTVMNAVNESFKQAKGVVEEINGIVKNIDSIKTTINIVVLLVFVSFIALVVVLSRKNGYKKLLIILSGILFGIFLFLGIGIIVINQSLDSQVTQMVTRLNLELVNSLKIVLTNSLGKTGGFIGNFIGSRGNFINLSLYIQMEIGYFIILIGSGATFAISILLNRKKSLSSVNEMKNENNEIITIEEITGHQGDEMTEEEKDSQEIKGIDEIKTETEIEETHEEKEVKDDGILIEEGKIQ